MLQDILPSLIAFIIGLPILLLFKRSDIRLDKKVGISFLYELIYVVLIFLPIHYVVLTVPESVMNWSGKLLAIAFTLIVFFLFRNDWNLSKFINIRPEKDAIKKVVIIGGITIISMCLLTIVFSKGKALDIERLAYQATMPGIDEELWRSIIIALLFPLIKTSQFKIGHPVVWFTTLIFALGHSLYLQDWNFGFSLDAFIITGILGYILGWTILKTRSILLALILHNMINFSTNFIEMVFLT